MANLESKSSLSLSQSQPDITAKGAVTWQMKDHNSFISAFMSTMRHGPITRQHEDWRRIESRLSKQAAEGPGMSSNYCLGNGKVLIITCKDDLIIAKDKLILDATAALKGNVVFNCIKAGHEAPIIKVER